MPDLAAVVVVFEAEAVEQDQQLFQGAGAGVDVARAVTVTKRRPRPRPPGSRAGCHSSVVHRRRGVAALPRAWTAEAVDVSGAAAALRWRRAASAAS